ncbi:MAG: hypothetical protein PHR21_08605 [Oscillospiraceae bacterium]|nr:hypothetical protein [Oscillospiraceae bacterium]MDD4368833.1 hypothetical protein [Oscillospiraceae bacterium]
MKIKTYVMNLQPRQQPLDILARRARTILTTAFGGRVPYGIFSPAVFELIQTLWQQAVALPAAQSSAAGLPALVEVALQPELLTEQDVQIAVRLDSADLAARLYLANQLFNALQLLANVYVLLQLDHNLSAAAADDLRWLTYLAEGPEQSTRTPQPQSPAAEPAAQGPVFVVAGRQIRWHVLEGGAKNEQWPPENTSAV